MNKLTRMFVFLAFAVLGLHTGSWIGKTYAVTVNPASNVLGDSANTGTTLIYRDSNGDFSSRDVSVRAIIPSDTTSSRAHVPALSSTTLLTVTPSAAGDEYLWVDALGAGIGMAFSTGTTQSAIVLSSSPTTACCRRP